MTAEITIYALGSNLDYDVYKFVDGGLQMKTLHWDFYFIISDGITFLLYITDHRKRMVTLLCQNLLSIDLYVRLDLYVRFPKTLIEHCIEYALIKNLFTKLPEKAYEYY